MEGDFHRSTNANKPGNFNPLPPHGGRLMPIVIFFFSPAFQSTPSAWRETNVLPNPMPNHGISIHSLRMEGDPLTAQLETIAFISIHSLRMEGDCIPISRILQTCHFNPLPPHGGRRRILSGGNVMSHFNPLPPHGGRPYPNC